MTEYQKFLADAIKSLTVLERKFYIEALEESLYEYCTDVISLSKKCNTSVASAKGVVGSLCKKGLMRAEEEVRGGKKFYDIFVTTRTGEELSFAEENLEMDTLEDIQRLIEELSI